jgi:hypothetical protein
VSKKIKLTAVHSATYVREYKKRMESFVKKDVPKIK